MEARVIYDYEPDVLSAAKKMSIEGEFVSAFNYFVNLRNSFLDRWNDEFLEAHKGELIEEDYNKFIQEKSNIIANKLNAALQYKVKVFADEQADTYGEVIIKKQKIIMRIEIVDEN